MWRTDRNIQYDNDDGDYHKGYVTPSVITAAGRQQLISPSAGATIAYDPATGQELWRVRSGGMNAAASATGQRADLLHQRLQRLSTVRHPARRLGRRHHQSRRLAIRQGRSQPQLAAVGRRSTVHDE